MGLGEGIGGRRTGRSQQSQQKDGETVAGEHTGMVARVLMVP
jgi:hypothetical protein